MAEYQGHRSWNAWNVSLWISNDEPLYRLAVEYIKQHHGKVDRAARYFVRELPEKTPDGAIYNLLSVREALKGLEIEVSV